MAHSEQSLYDKVSYQTIVVIVLLMVFVNGAVLLQLVSTGVMKLQLKADDYMVIMAAVRIARQI